MSLLDKIKCKFTQKIPNKRMFYNKIVLFKVYLLLAQA